MKKVYSNLLLFFGVACVLFGAVALLLGRLEGPQTHTLPALGLILIGAGASSKRNVEEKK